MIVVIQEQGSPRIVADTNAVTLYVPSYTLVTDGNKGDISVSNNGGTWSLNTGSVTYDKIQTVTAAKILGRRSSSSGAVEELTLGAGLSLSGTTLYSTGGGGAGITDGDKGDITVSGGGTAWTIDNSAVTLAKMQNITAGTLMGRDSLGGTGAPQQITLGTGFSLDGGVLNYSETGTVRSVSVTSANGVSGTVATPTTTPAITITLGAITPTTVNGLTITSSTGTLTVTNLKTLSVSNTLTLAGTDGSTLNVGAGGTLGSAAFTASSAYQASDPELSAIAGLVSAADSFPYFTGLGTAALQTIGSSMRAFLGSGASADLAAAVIDETGTGALVFATSPTLVTPTLGAATATSVNGLTITSSTGTLTITNLKTLSVSNTLTLAGTDGSTLNVGTGGTLGSAAFTSSSAYQASDPELSALAGLVSAADSFPYFTGSGTASLLVIGSATRTFLGSPSSANLSAAMTTKTGTGLLVFGTSPTLTTPVLGVATATTINGLGITTSTGTLTIANLKTLTVNKTLTFDGVDGSTLNVGSGGTLGSAAFTASTAYQAADAELSAIAGLVSAADSFPYFTGLGTAALQTINSTMRTFLGSGTSANLAAAISDETGSGALVFATSPTLVTPSLGAATATSINGLTITSSTGTLTVTNLKTLSVSNTLTLAGTDGSTLNVGAGGTLGSAAFTASTAYQAADAELSALAGLVSAADSFPYFTGLGTAALQTINSSMRTFLGSGTSANLAAAISDETGTGALVFATSPTLVTPSLGAATATSINGLTITSSTGTLTVTNLKTLSVSNTLTLAGTDGSTLNVGAGGTLGSAAFTASSAYQASDPELSALAGLVSAADSFPYFTGSGTAALQTIGSAMRTFLGAPSSANLLAAMTTKTGTGNNVFSTAPVFDSTVSIGTAGGTTGSIALNGTTSGTVNITVNAAAGGYTLTLPATAGSPSQVLTTNGSGGLSWTTPAAGSGSNAGSKVYMNRSFT